MPIHGGRFCQAGGTFLGIIKSRFLAGLPLFTIVQKTHISIVQESPHAIVQIMKAITLWNVPGTSHCAHFSAHLKFFGLPKFRRGALLGTMTCTFHVS
jgi:hypothetical protein